MMRPVTLIVATLLLVGCAPEARDSAGDDTLVVYLVRHAERAEDGTNDPPISAAGEERARALALLLDDAGLTHMHTTDYLRTRSTALPTATREGLELLVYDPGDLAGFASSLRATAGRHLVVGHSNTTGNLVGALGGDPGEPIAEDEYDRMYVVTITAKGVSTELRRYGSPRSPGG